MWFEQKFVLDEETTQKLKLAGIVPWAGQIAGLVMVAVGTLFLTILCISSCVQSRKALKRQQMEINLNENETTARQKKEVSPLLNQNLHAKIMQQRRRP